MTSTEDYYYRVFLPNEEKKRKEKMKESVEIGKEEEPWEAVHLELRDKEARFFWTALCLSLSDISVSRVH